MALLLRVYPNYRSLARVMLSWGLLTENGVKHLACERRNNARFFGFASE